VLTVACGRSTGAMPTAPSSFAASPTSPSAPAPAPVQDFPALSGRWRVFGTIVFRNLESGNALSWGGCSGSFTVTAQNGGSFTGRFGTQGGGWNSDRFCTASGTFSGELLTFDGSVAQARLRADFEHWPLPSVSPPCELVSPGDGVWTGSATGGDMKVRASDVLRCPANVDGGAAGMPREDFERSVSLTFERS
jgi:hypothetical protein